ncbi:benzyl alcohol O-benzoyltransferase-like [Heracleum sosnowskyi]|uniref:Benzyl alcohol O-benzoyltransferase-like n=1 Tax=Heracleum sosnowskyi TaxID=360622 RepID=A0AAD8NCF4_9APIA|nr:benzyl alcohol O-benzoyltransferase-like [Heracleum sosnowskyi]
MDTQESLVFTVTRRSPELITPAKPTPYEYKLLSDIDDQESLRFHVSVIQFYRKKHNFVNVLMMDPVKVIRDALSKTLVYYYPFAGRLREGAGRKLGVECTGEGVMFIEADADVTLEQFGGTFQPPFPCIDQLLFDVPGSSGVVDCPLLLIQVTRLKCGGFVCALRFNHTMSDTVGFVQFLNALGEIARGASAPSILPVWQRERLNARDPPRVTCTHHEYDDVVDMKGTIIPLHDMVCHSFFFSRTDIRALRRLVPPHLRTCSTFEVLTAFLWRSRTRCLQLYTDEEVRMLCIADARTIISPPLPVGYYGNAFVYRVALTTAGKLCQKPLGYALELVKKSKEDVTEEYMKSLADLMVLKGRPHFGVVGTYLVADVTRIGLGEIDFGWGKPIYGGPARGGMGVIPEVAGMASFFIPSRNREGEQGIVVPVCVPAFAMEKFATELNRMLRNNDPLVNDNTSLFIKSAM